MTLRLAALAFCAVGVAVHAASPAQTPDFLRSQATTEPIVRGRPFSADGTVTLKLILFDGTHIEPVVPARYYRDTEGRMRREQTIMGLSPLDPGKDAQAVVTIMDPVGGFLYTIVGDRREAQRMSIPLTVMRSLQEPMEQLRTQLPARESVVPQGFATKDEALGTRQVNGVQAVGRKTTTTIPAGLVGNDRPIEVTDEVWTADELKLQISRAEPPADLFRIPADYKIVDIPGGIR